MATQLPAPEAVARRAEELTAAVRELLKKHGHKIPATARQEVENALAAAGDARLAGTEPLLKAVERLDQAAATHLGAFKKSALREYAESIGSAVLLALALRAFVFEPFKIPSASMVPTLLVGDHLFVNKFILGLRIPFMNYKLGSSWNLPERGDVIVFEYPGNEPEHQGKDYIKRVIGLPGDTIRVEGNQLYVNGATVSHADAGGYQYWDQSRFAYAGEPRWVVIHAGRHVERLGGKAHYILTGGGNGPLEGAWTVQPGHFFCMGDNRDNSADSRTGWQVPIDNIKGRALFIWWSYSAKDGVRWERMFEPVDPEVELRGGPQ